MGLIVTFGSFWLVLGADWLMTCCRSRDWHSGVEGSTLVNFLQASTRCTQKGAGFSLSSWVTPLTFSYLTGFLLDFLIPSNNTVDHVFHGFWSLSGMIIPTGPLTWSCIFTHNKIFSLVKLVTVALGCCPNSLFCSQARASIIDRMVWTSFQVKSKARVRAWKSAANLLVSLINRPLFALG